MNTCIACHAWSQDIAHWPRGLQWFADARGVDQGGQLMDDGELIWRVFEYIRIQEWMWQHLFLDVAFLKKLVVKLPINGMIVMTIVWSVDLV